MLVSLSADCKEDSGTAQGRHSTSAAYVVPLIYYCGIELFSFLVFA